MIRFTKRAICPSSEMLAAYRDDALAPVLLRAVAAHLGECDFCAAEFRLLAVSAHKMSGDAQTKSARIATRESASEIAHAQEEGVASDAPPVPLALRLFAESRLAESALRSSLTRLRAA
jgi:hypothetical protein